MTKITKSLSIVALMAVAAPALAQHQAGDIVVGRSNTGSTAYWYFNGATWTEAAGDTNTPNYTTGSAFGPNYGQSTEYDNDGIWGDPAGNLLTCNFGNSFTGFEIYNMATDVNPTSGGTGWTSLWSIAHESLGAMTTRAGGLSVNPSGDRVAFCNNDGLSLTDGEGDSVNGSSIVVLNYDRGANPGQGLGILTTPGEADIYGPRIAGGISICAAGVTQGTTWLRDDVVACFNGYGEIVIWDISDVAPGTDASPRLNPTTAFQPNIEAGSYTAVTGIFSFSAQFTDIDYNPAVDPYHVYCSVTQNGGSYPSYLYMLSYDPTVPADQISMSVVATLQLHPVVNQHETREISLDGNGDLWYSSYAGSGADMTVGRLMGATNPANWTTANVSDELVSGSYTSYSGMDVAAGVSLPGDTDRDNDVDFDDFSLVGNNYGQTSGMTWEDGDFDGDGDVDFDDFSIVGNNYGLNFSR